MVRCHLLILSVFLLFHHIECVAIEDAHQPGTERAALLEAVQPAPDQQKRSLGDLFRQRALAAA